MRTWISRRLRPLLAATAVLGLAWAAWSQREAIASFDWSIDHGLLALAVALFAIAPLLQGLTFVLIAAALFFFVVKPVNYLMARRRTGPEVESTTRDCPECLSAIPIAAHRCAFCTSEVAPA